MRFPPLWLFRTISLNRCRGLGQFVFRILAQQFAVKILTAIAVVAIFPDVRTTEHNALPRDPVMAAILIVLVSPIVETLLLQTALIEICRAFRGHRALQFAVGSVPFAALHFIGGVVSGIAAGIVGGVFFSHTYLEVRQRSWWTATWVTAVTHGLHNLIVFPVLLLLAS